MQTCRYCGGQITFRHINGRLRPVHLTGSCRSRGYRVQPRPSSVLEDVASFVGAVRKLCRARDDSSKIALVQQPDFRDKIPPAIGVLAIATAVISLHIYEDGRLGFFANLWSSSVAVVASCFALALWLTGEYFWRGKYVNYLMERRWKLTWSKIFAPYLLFVSVIVACIIAYKITY